MLLDGYYTGSAEDFSALLGDDSIQVYKLNKTWNTYSPDATVGLWTVASLFYPQYFEGEVPVEPSDDNRKTTPCCTWWSAPWWCWSPWRRWCSCAGATSEPG